MDWDRMGVLHRELARGLPPGRPHTLAILSRPSCIALYYYLLLNTSSFYNMAQHMVHQEMQISPFHP